MMVMNAKKWLTRPRRQSVKFFLLTIVICIVLFEVYNNAITTSLLTREFGRFKESLRCPNTTKRSRADIARAAQKAFPHLPILFWEENRYRNRYYKNASCARFPDIHDLHVYDQYWQSMRVGKFVIHLFAAYYDVRERCSTCPALRILGMINSNKNPPFRLYCQIWFANRNETVIVKTKEYFNVIKCWWHSCDDDYIYTYLMTCPIPQKYHSERPIFVSLVERKCDRATNVLRITYNDADKKGDFAVCVKMVDMPYTDFSVRLVEWIELVRLLGGEKIFFYILHIHERIARVLQYYERQGVVQIVPITLGGFKPNMADFQHLYIRGDQRSWYQRTLHELISVNDCFYKNMYRYKYITVLDTDEVLVPVKEKTWSSYITKLYEKDGNNSEKAAFLGGNVLFTPICDDATELNDDIPTYMYMLQHVLKYVPRWGKLKDVKTIFNTELVEALYIHYPLKCVTVEPCKKHSINLEELQAQHYRSKHYNERLSCKQLRPQLTNDTTLWRYKAELIDRTTAILKDLGLLTV